MKELRVIPSDQIDVSVRQRQTLLICDESAIRCQTFRDIQAMVGSAGMGVVLAMPESQYRIGLRGFGKAKILAAMCELEGVMPLQANNLDQQLANWEKVIINGPVIFANNEAVLPGNNEVRRFEETDDPFDREMLARAKYLVRGSNCWLDPAGCIFTLNRNVVVEATSTSFNGSKCREIPFKHQEMELNTGIRPQFCDSLHAERVGVSRAAKNGIQLSGSTVYVTKYPCRSCAEDLIGAGVQRVVFDQPSYGIVEVGDLFEKNGVKIARLSDDINF